MKTTIFKRTLVLFLAALMAFSSLPLATGQDAPGDAAVTTTETAVGTNPLAAAVADAVNDRAEGETTYSILGMELDGFTAAVTCYAPAGSTMVAALYDEDTTQMLTSGSVKLEAEAELVNIEMAECELPEYYYVKVFLLAEDHTALTESFTYERYTRRMEEFYAITPEDFDADHVVMFGDDDNFAAVNENAKIIQCSENVNNVTVVDYEKSEYTFINPDESLKALKKGDIFYYEIDDTLIVGTIIKIENNKDGSVTIFTDPDEKPVSLFDYIHVDTYHLETTEHNTTPQKAPRHAASDYDKIDKKHLKLPAPIKVQFSVSTDDEPTQFLVPSDWSQMGVDDDSLHVDKKAETKLEVLFSGELNAEADIEYCYHVKWGPDDYYLNIDITTTLTGTVSVSVSAAATISIDLLKFDIPTPVPGLSVYVNANFSFGISGEISATGTVKVIKTANFHKESKDKSLNQAKGGKPEFEISFDVEITVTITAELKLGVGVEIALGVVSVGVYAKLTAEAKIKPLVLSISNDRIGAALFNKDWSAYADGEKHAEHNCKWCFSVDVTISLTAGAEAGFFMKSGAKDYGAYGLITLENELSASAELTPLKLLDKKLRASYVGGNWEFEWMDGDVACPHMRFLTKITLTEKNSKKAMADVPLKISSVNIKWHPASEYASIPQETDIKTDENGIARCYLPAATYQFDGADNRIKIVECSPNKEEFRIKDDMVSFSAVGVRSREYTVKLVEQGTGKAVAGASVYKDLNLYTSDSAGCVKMNLFPGEEVGITVSGDGVHQSFKILPAMDSSMIELHINQAQRKITGKVADSETGKTVSGVLVTAVPESGGSPVSVTAASGFFELTLTDGTYHITFSSNEYHGKTVSQTVSKNASMGTVELEKKKYSMVSGTVVDKATGQAIAGANIAVTMTETGTAQTVANATTNQNGQFTVKVPYGNITVSARAIIGGKNTFDKKTAGINTETYAFASPFALTVHHTITGKVTDSRDGQALSGVSVLALPSGVGEWNSTTTGSDGKYTLELKPGNYQVSFSLDGFGKKSVTKTIDRDVNFGTTKLNKKEAKYEISGIVLDNTNEQPISGAKITTVLTKDNTTKSYYSDENGEFSLPLDEGYYKITATYDGCAAREYNYQAADYSGWQIKLNPSGINAYADVLFGSYPQSRVDDPDLLAELKKVNKTWTSYGYYCGTGYWTTDSDGKSHYVDSMAENEMHMQQTDDMRFSDFFYNGSKYRAVVFDKLRDGPATAWSDHDGVTLKRNTEYYFKYEPLGWRILDSATGLVITLNIIDAQEYQQTVFEHYQDKTKTDYANEYAVSSIRNWLNYDFYETAFTEAQKDRIKKTALSNKPVRPVYNAESTRYRETTDKIFLISYADAHNKRYGFSTSEDNYYVPPTDYSIYQGLRRHVFHTEGNNSGVSVGSPFNSVDGDFLWWLRSAYEGRQLDYASSYGNNVFRDMNVLDVLGICAACQLTDLKSDTTVSPTLFSQMKGSAKKSIAVRNTSANSLTVSRSDIVKGETYVLLAVKDPNAENLFNADNLLYIDQQTAESATVTFNYIPRETVENATATIYGMSLADHTHSYTAAVTKEPTCAEPGETTYTCACGDSYTEAIPATGEHAFGEWTVTKKATVDAEGEEVRTCSVCGEKETRAIPKAEPAAPEFTPGDVNGDGKIGSDDARLALRTSVKLEKDITDGTAAYKAADYNGDGVVKSEDARAILRVSVKLDPFG